MAATCNGTVPAVRKIMERALTWLLATLLIAVNTVIGARAQPQDAIASARELYAAADYEAALQRLNALPASSRRSDDSLLADQYRALCLLALGRTQEAESAIAAVVTGSPFFHLSETDVSPRVRSTFRDVRRRLLPAIIQKKYDDAKGAFERKDLAAADGFKQ